MKQFENFGFLKKIIEYSGINIKFFDFSDGINVKIKKITKFLDFFWIKLERGQEKFLVLCGN